MFNRPHRYPSYLLRLWPVRLREGTSWRASLVNVQSGEILGFATLERLKAFLEAQTTALAEGERTSFPNHANTCVAAWNPEER